MRGSADSRYLLKPLRLTSQLRTNRISQKVCLTLQRLLRHAESFQQFAKVGLTTQQNSTIFECLLHRLVIFSPCSKRRIGIEKKSDPPRQTPRLRSFPGNNYSRDITQDFGSQVAAALQVRSCCKSAKTVLIRYG